MSAKISAAFVKAQKGFGAALKTSTNPHFKSRYADLAACVEAVIDSLNANGIALMQNFHEAEHGVMVETVFIHESGETLSGGKLFVPASKQDAQGFGSAITYGRRYGLMAACGIAPEDDDGNAATKSKHEPRSYKKEEALLRACASISSLAECWGKLDEDSKKALVKVKDECKTIIDNADKDIPQ